MTVREPDLPIFFVFATRNDPLTGVTGAAIGTETVVDMLAGHFDIEWLVLETNGLGQLGKRSWLRRAMSAAQATLSSFSAIFRIALRGIRGPQIEYFYFLPATSTMGILRNAMLTVVLALFFPKAKLLLHIRNGNYFERMSWWKEALQFRINRRAHRIFVLSRLLMPEDISHSGAKDSQICVLPNTIDEALVPAEVRSRPDTPPLRVLYLSNFIRTKGYLALLDAAQILADRKRGPEFEFSFYGQWLTQEDREEAERIARDLSLQGMKISINGTVADRNEVQALYASHHVFCLPTLYAAEAQPRSILEAMANGCAILATNYRSIPEQVIDAQTGFLLDSQRPDLIADRLSAFLPADMENFAVANRALFDERFSRASVRGKLLEELGVMEGQ